MTDILQKLTVAYAKAKGVRDALWGGGLQQGAVSVDDLKQVVADTCGLNVELNSVNFAAKHLVSLVERHPDNLAVIYVRFDTEPTLQRYAVVKELCHLLVDEPADFSADYGATIEGLLRESDETLYAQTFDLKASDRTMHSENLAAVMADELMYDFRLRDPDLKALKQTEVTLQGLALRYKVPANLPSRVLRPLRLQLSGVLWKLVG